MARLARGESDGHDVARRDVDLQLLDQVLADPVVDRDGAGGLRLPGIAHAGLLGELQVARHARRHAAALQQVDLSRDVAHALARRHARRRHGLLVARVKQQRRGGFVFLRRQQRHGDRGRDDGREHQRERLAAGAQRLEELVQVHGWLPFRRSIL
jgi:hypothetical protein